jgi:hypothetical protein
MLTALTAALLAVPAGGITWSPSLDAAQEQARTEMKVLFVAAHMPGEAANERMARTIYTDKAITRLAGMTTNVLAMAMDRYEDAGTRVDLGGLTDEQLRRLDIDIRARVLKPDAQGYVVAPQHVFIAPDGEVLLSVPYELTRGELEWCFLEAIRAVDPTAELRPSAGVRPPKRLIKAGVLEGTDESIGATPATLEEVRTLIKEANKGRGSGRWDKMMRILTADEEEAREFITKQLRSGGKRGDANKAGMILNIQRRSPASWWEVVIEFADHSNPDVREEVAACLEVLAAPESLRDIKKVLAREKDPRLAGMWLRAQASSGAADAKIRKTILNAVERSKEPITAANATLALGFLAPDEEVNEHLSATLADDGQPVSVRTAAICAMAMTRDEAFEEILRPLSESGGDLEDAAAAALRTLEQGDLKPLGPHVRRACGDEVNRERLFGVVRR